MHDLRIAFSSYVSHGTATTAEVFLRWQLAVSKNISLNLMPEETFTIF